MKANGSDIQHDEYDFVARQLELLGERDPLSVLRDTPGRLAYLLGRAPSGRVTRPWAPGKWSPLEILAHLSMTEWVFGLRTRTVLFDPSPILQPVRQDLWVARGTATGDVADHLQDFAALRRANIRLWVTLREEDLERTGYHAEAETEMSLGFLLRLLAGHDLSHTEQIRRAVEGD